MKVPRSSRPIGGEHVEEAFVVPGRRSEKQFVDFRPPQKQVQVVLPGEADPTVKLERFAGNK